MFRKFILFSLKHPKLIVLSAVVLVAISLIQFPRIQVDTDPENMLPYDAPVRVFHREMKEEFGLYDFVVLGVVNDKHQDGVFNVDTLNKIYSITGKIEEIDGVVARKLVAISTKDNIEQGDIGSVRFKWLMDGPIQTQEEAYKIREEARDHPVFRGSIVSDNNIAIAIYVPIKEKDESYEISEEIREIIKDSAGDEQFYITGMPVAQDQFGVEMFRQMAISAPLAGLVIYLLMLFFFRSAKLIIAPMLVAVMTVIITMGLLIGLGYPVHIMSSMIPIFLMPIAVLDSIHILSEFFDKYREFNDRRKTLLFVLDELFSPMLFTSLTSAVGFFSLSFSPIPPVQVFGVFVAVGILIAWILTIIFIPAYVMLMNSKSFQDFGKSKETHKRGFIDMTLEGTRKICMKRYKLIIALTLLTIGISVYGISRIVVNDNPVRWFTYNHPIREASRVLNGHFAGTYEAYLVFEAQNKNDEVFIQPDMLRYIEGLQQSIDQTGYTGKSTSITDLVKKIYYELLGGDKKNNIVPSTKPAVAQCLISFENSHKPDDLWQLITPDYSKANVWFQLKEGSNQSMTRVVHYVDQYIKDNPPPYEINYHWAGLTYINVIWQNNMVVGMQKNFAGSFVIVLFMMLFLFRSPFKALISMIPLTVTILFIYGLLGFIGKDYDMPVAVLSALTLGLSIDFAIHFIQRAIEVHNKSGNWPDTAATMFAGPGRAIVRNALVVAIGFLPLLATPLVPYKTVGFFMFSIMAVSSVATLFILPAIISLKPKIIFVHPEKGFACHWSHCVLIATFVSLAVAYVLWGYTHIHWQVPIFISFSIIAISSVICHMASQRKICLRKENDHEQ